MSNISLAQNILSVKNSSDANLDIDNYSTDELISILNIQEPTEQSIKNSTDHYIKKFLDEGDVEMSNFFKEIKKTLLEELDSFNNPSEELEIDDKDEELNILNEQYKDNGVPDEKTSTRLQEIGIYRSKYN